MSSSLLPFSPPFIWKLAYMDLDRGNQSRFIQVRLYLREIGLGIIEVKYLDNDYVFLET